MKSVTFRLLLAALLPAIFASIQAAAQTFTNLHNFTGGNDGGEPFAGLVLSSNTLYGTTLYGGTNNTGAVFAINTDGTGFSTLHSFGPASGPTNVDGVGLFAGLALFGGRLYGTAAYGGTNGYGTVFAINTNGTGFTVLHTFVPNSDGAEPYGDLVVSDDTLYGTTSAGGTNGTGTLFALNTNGTGFVVLHTFSQMSTNSMGTYTNSDGSSPQAGLVLAGGTLYGVAPAGGTNGAGVVFAVNTDGTGFDVLHTFAVGSDGSQPIGSLALSGSTLYGAAYAGGMNTNGTVFALNTNGAGFTVLHSFTGATGYSKGGPVNSDGAAPADLTGLILSGGMLFGTAQGGGTNGFGTVFSISGTNLTTLYSFTPELGSSNTNSDGAFPRGGLVFSGGTLYGTTPQGGTNNNGTLFALNLAPAIKIQPANASVLAGGVTNLSLTASGPGTLSYDWYFNATNLVQSGTNSTLMLINVTTSNAGSYFVVVTNAFGSVVSSNALLTEIYMSQQPTNLTATAGGTVSFSVQMSGGGPFTYQWQFNGVNLPTNGVIMPVAGNGSTSFSGDGGPSAAAGLNPHGVAVDSVGNLFIADYANSRIRKVGTNGIISTFAGKGYGYSGDGGPATNATMRYTAGVALDKSGNLFIADYNNSCIRKVDTNGIITTFAGIGTSGFSGDGNPATNAALNAPSGIAVDTLGNLFIADYSNRRVRKVDTNGTITTVAGNGTNGFSGDGGQATNATMRNPSGVALDNLGNLFIADYNNNTVRKVDTNGIITTVAGNGTAGFSGDGGMATNASLFYPEGVAVDSVGNLFIADYHNLLIREVWPNGIITTVAGNRSTTYSDGGSALKAGLNYPMGVAVDSAGNFFIADTYRIHKVVGNPAYSPTFSTLTVGNLSATNAGSYTVVIRSSLGSITSSVVTLTVQAPPVINVQPASLMVGVGANASFSVGVLGSGPFGYNLYFGGTNLIESGTNSIFTLPAVNKNASGNYTVVVTNTYGSAISQVATLTVVLPPTITIQPTSQTNVAGSSVTFAVTAAGIGPITYQWQFNGTNLPNNIITTVAGHGTATGYSGDGGPATNASLHSPCGLAFDGSGNLYIADGGNNRIRKVDTNGIITTVAGTGASGSSGDGGLATNATFNFCTGVTFDNSGELVINDEGNGRVCRVDSNGVITTIGRFNASSTREVFDASGNLYVSGYNPSDIVEVNNYGGAVRVAGGGGGFGDGGPAVQAALNYPIGMTFSSQGNLFFCDAGNNRVRKVDGQGIITTFAGNGSTGLLRDGGLATNASLSFPQQVAFDQVGSLFVSDYQHGRVRMVDTNGIITTIAGGGTKGLDYVGAATNIVLVMPVGLAFDASGNLFVSDTFRVREIHYAGFPTLVLTNITSTNSGNYSVIVSTPYGSVTSSVAVLDIPPYITVQPQSASVFLASNTTFSVNASGSSSLNYQWLFNGTNLTGANNTSYAISNAQPDNAGSYSATIINNYGSVTSSTVNLTVTLPPVVPTFTQTNGSSDFGLTWSVIPNLTYQVEYKTNLAQADWINLGDPITTTNAAASILDSLGTDSQRFYRVQLVQ